MGGVKRANCNGRLEWVREHVLIVDLTSLYPMEGGFYLLLRQIEKYQVSLSRACQKLLTSSLFIVDFCFLSVY